MEYEKPILYEDFLKYTYPHRHNVLTALDLLTVWEMGELFFKRIVAFLKQTCSSIIIEINLLIFAAYRS